MDSAQLLELADFWPCRILLTAAELDLFAALEQPAFAGEVALVRGTDPRATELLCNALAALGVLEKEEERFAIPENLREHLLPGPECIVASIVHRANLWRAWSSLTEVVLSGAPAVDPYERDERPDDDVRRFIGAMAVSGRRTARSAIEMLPLSGMRTVLDIGGGPGVYAMEFCRAEPGLRVTILDLERVCKIAGEYIAGTDYEGRIGFVPGEARTVDHDRVLAASGGEGYDLVFTSNLIHSMSAGEVQLLLDRAAGWIKPGGRLVVKDFLLDDSRTSPHRAAVFAINMLVNTPGGRSYTWSEVEQWAADALGTAGRNPDIDRIELPDGVSGMVVALDKAQ